MNNKLLAASLFYLAIIALLGFIGYNLNYILHSLSLDNLLIQNYDKGLGSLIGAVLGCIVSYSIYLKAVDTGYFKY